MKVAVRIQRVALGFALNMSVFWASGNLGWCAQSQPAPKDQSGSQGGSSGKADPMGSQGSSETPTPGDSNKTNKKKPPKKKNKKAESDKARNASPN